MADLAAVRSVGPATPVTTPATAMTHTDLLCDHQAMFFTSRACIPAIIAIAIACCAARRASNYNPAEDDLQLPEF